MDGRCHAHGDLAERVGVSPASVGQLLSELEQMGLEIQAIAGESYRLRRPLEWLDKKRIDAALAEPARRLIAHLEIHDELDSTNTYLAKAAGENAPSGSVCLAESQRAGKGRSGRTWLSPFGSNVYLSILWHFDHHEAIAGLSLAAGVAAVKATRNVGIAGCTLKWPNDILWHGRKLGGILIEVSGAAGGRFAAIIGVGLNTYIPASLGHRIDQDWVDTERILGGRQASRNRLAAALLNELLPLLEQYQTTGLTPYLAEWRRFHDLEGRSVTLQLADRKIEGKIAGLTDQGWLILQDEDGRRQCFTAGEVSVRVEAVEKRQ